MGRADTQKKRRCSGAEAAGNFYDKRDYRGRRRSIIKNRNSRLLGHVNLDGQKYRFVKKK